MFQNLTKTKDITANINSQFARYGPAGDAVIQVFVNQTQGMAYDQIRTNRMVVRAAMEAEINAQGPTKVSKHCVDPSIINVVDIGASALNNSNVVIFINYIMVRATLLDERNDNNCLHIQVTK